VNGNENSSISALAPDFARLGVFHDALSLALEQKLTDEVPAAKTADSSAREISELKSALLHLTGCVQHLMGDSSSKQYKMFGNNSTAVRTLFCLPLPRIAYAWAM
jgi:hypothetical protein